MKRCLLTLLLIVLFCAPAYAHDLTDREVESINTSMELGIWQNMIYLDYWIAIGDLEAPNFRPLIDTDSNGTISDEESELFLDKLRKDIISGGLRIVIDDRADLSFALYGSRLITTDAKNAPVPIKINFEFLLDLERLGQYDKLKFQAGRKHILDFWMTNTLSKPVVIKAFFAQGDGINIPYTPEQRARALMFKSGFWLKPQEYNYIRLNYEDTGTGNPKFDRPATLAGSTAGKDEMLGFLNTESLSLWIILAALGFALAYGAVHALAPGHGKTLVAAYLIGSRGTVAQAILLGLIVTATHLSTVIIAGVLALTASHYVNQTALSVYLGLASGLIIVIMGVWLFARRLTNPLGTHNHSHNYPHTHNHNNTHSHSDDEGQPHSHSHHPGDEGHHSHTHSDEASGLEKVSLKQILALGISGGMVPCPTAIVILLMAITLKKTLWGLSLILAFSLGLAGVLIVIGIMMVLGVSLAERLKQFAVYIIISFLGLFLLSAFLFKLPAFVIIVIILTVLGISVLLLLSRLFGFSIIRVLSILSPALITIIGIAIIVMDLINSGVIILNPAALP